MKKIWFRRCLIASIIIMLTLSIVSLILRVEAACGGFFVTAVLLWECRNADKPTAASATKNFYLQRGKITKYRVICIVICIIIFLASIVQLMAVAWGLQ